MLGVFFFVCSREDSAVRDDTDCEGQELRQDKGLRLGLEPVQQQLGYSLQTGAKIQNTHCTVLQLPSVAGTKSRRRMGQDPTSLRAATTAPWDL